MKEKILKKERVFHFISLGIIAGSMFLKEPIHKFSMLLLGILGLIILSILKKQQTLIWVYLGLLLAAGIFYYFKFVENAPLI